MKQADILIHAKDYLDQIDNYTDPLTGKNLPTDSVFRDPSVRQSLFFAAKNLGWIIAYDNDGDRLPFAPDPNLRKWVKPDQRDVGTKDMVTILNRTSDMAKNRGLDLAVLKEYLVDRGYLRLSNEQYTVTPEGIQAGFRIYQTSYGPTVIFAPSAQQLLLDELDDLAEYCVAHCPKTSTKKRKVKIADRETAQGNIQVVRALSDGLHPLTGQAVAPNDPAAQERMKTCFGYAARALERALELGFFSAKAPFRLSREKWNGLSPSAEACTLGEFLGTVNAGLDDSTAVQSLSAQELTDLLEAEGLAAKVTASTGRARLVPTSKGETLGIGLREGCNERGELYQTLVYSPEIQRMLIAKLERFVQD